MTNTQASRIQFQVRSVERVVDRKTALPQYDVVEGIDDAGRVLRSVMPIRHGLFYALRDRIGERIAVRFDALIERPGFARGSLTVEDR